MSAAQSQTNSQLTTSAGDITITAPGTVAVGVGQTDPIKGVRLTLSAPAAKGEIFTVVVMNNSGTIDATNPAGPPYGGSRPTCINIVGTMSQVTAALATLTDQAPGAGGDTLTVQASDSLGDSTATLYSPITIASAPSIVAPSSVTVKTGVATSLTGLSIAETNASTSETFTVTLTDASGVFTQTMTGATGSGTNSLTIHGNLGIVNRDLKNLKLTAGVADTIVEQVTDSFGNSAGPVDIPVGLTAASTAVRFAQAAASFAGPAAAPTAPARDAGFPAHLWLAAPHGHSAFA